MSGNVYVPGEELSTKTMMLDKGAAMTQNFAPLKHFSQELLAFHWYNGDMNRQLAAYHYCSCINEDVSQCLVYDKDDASAKLIGIVYLISDKLFKLLPEDEKKYWHDHVYEIKGGLIIAPRVPNMAEHEAVAKMINKYAKVFHFWQVDRGDPLPMGPPQLMMALTEPGQLRPELVSFRNQISSSSIEDSRNNRQDIPVDFEIDPAANQWKSGKAIQFTTGEVEQKNVVLMKI